MSSKYERKLIPQSHDRRRKLTDEQKVEIHEKFLSGRYTYNELASMYGVSRSTVRFITHPEYVELDKANKALRGNTYDKQKVKEKMAKHRAYKKSLDKKGILIEKNKPN